MESKLIILLAFATLALGAEELKVSYGLSESEVAILSKVISNQETAMTAYLEGFEPVFDKLDELAAELVFNLKPTCHNDSRKLAEGLVEVKKAVDSSLDSVLLFLGESCPAIEVACRTTHDDLEDVFERITAALDLAKSGNYSKNQAAIEKHRAGVEKDFKNLVRSVYNSISTCLGEKDADTQGVISNAEDGSRIGLVHVTNAIFNAITRYTAAVARNSPDISLIFEIEDLRKLAATGLKDDIEYKFSVLRTLFINSKINQAGIIIGLSSIQYAQTVASHRYGEALEVVFGTILAHMTQVDLKYKDDGKLDFSRDQAAMNEAIALFDAADIALFDSLKILHPNRTDEIMAAQEQMFADEDVGVGAIYTAIYAAADTAANKSYSETINTIEVIRNQTVPLANDYTEAFFRFIRDDRILDPEIIAQIRDLNEKAIQIDTIIMDVLFDAIRILAEIVNEGRVTDGDFSDVRAELATTISGLDDFTQYVSAAYLIVLEVLKAL